MLEECLKESTAAKPRRLFYTMEHGMPPTPRPPNPFNQRGDVPEMMPPWGMVPPLSYGMPFKTPPFDDVSKRLSPIPPPSVVGDNRINMQMAADEDRANFAAALRRQAPVIDPDANLKKRRDDWLRECFT